MNSNGPCRGKDDLERFRYSRTFRLHYPKERGPNGRRLCRWCGQEVTDGRHLWCFDGCVQEYQVASGKGNVIQGLVEKRDQGICAICGIDTAKLKRVIRALRNRFRLRWRRCTCLESNQQRSLRDKRQERQTERAEQTLRRIYERYPWAFHRYGAPSSLNPLTRSLWEADHIVPVVEGGGACGLDNYRTLCLPCHKSETKALRKRLKKAKG